jgi:cell division protein ZapD
VGAEFQRLGATLIDYDAIAHELTAPGGAAIGAIRQSFGPEYINAEGAMDRKRMRDLAFTTPEAKHRLEKILHPMIRAESGRRADAAATPYVVMMNPILVETARDDRHFDRVVVVDCPEETQVARVMARNGLPAEEVRRIMAAQVSREARLAHATDVIENAGALSDLGPRVAALHARFLDLARFAPTPARESPTPDAPAPSSDSARGLGSATPDTRESAHTAAPTGKESAPTAAPEAAALIIYEYPLTERIRTLLRLEDLFERARHFLALSDPLEHHAALLTLFEILEVASRADLKSDLLQELERQKQVLLSFRSNPDVEQAMLSEITGSIEQALAALFKMMGKIGQYLRENEWLMAIKQRTSIPGGACEFDLPSYHFWLHRSAAERAADLAAWIQPLYPLRDGSSIVLRLLREGGKPQSHVAHQGTFSQMLGGRTAQMVRIRLLRDTGVIPEISANKYALNVRFTQFSMEPRPKLAEADVQFELTFCNL